MMTKKEKGSKSAKMLYRPIGLASSILSGVIAGIVFKKVWEKVSHSDGAPKALKSEFGLGQVLVAADVQGAIYAGVKALVDRGGARLFQRATGEWPGD